MKMAKLAFNSLTTVILFGAILLLTSMALSGCAIAPYKARVSLTRDTVVMSPWKVNVKHFDEGVVVNIFPLPGNGLRDVMPSWWWIVPGPPTIITHPSERWYQMNLIGEWEEAPVYKVYQDHEGVWVKIEGGKPLRETS